MLQHTTRSEPHATEPFTFGIALLPRASARNWLLVEALIGLTWASLAAQTDQKFRVLIAGHDRPRTLADDPRLTFVSVDWPVESPGPHNADGGRKKDFLSDLVLSTGGGLFMALDADDWVDVRLVETARNGIGADAVGGLIGAGFATDFQRLRRSALPLVAMPGVDFHHVCGSSTVARLRPDLADPLRSNPFRLLRSHHEWDQTAAEHGAALVRLPLVGAYVVNTSENHSELHGPYAEWRRTFVECLDRDGAALDQAFVSRFGLEHVLVPRVQASWQSASATPPKRRSTASSMTRFPTTLASKRCLVATATLSRSLQVYRAWLQRAYRTRSSCADWCAEGVFDRSIATAGRVTATVCLPTS